MKARKHAASNVYKCTTKLMNMKYKTAFATFPHFHLFLLCRAATF